MLIFVLGDFSCNINAVCTTANDAEEVLLFKEISLDSFMNWDHVWWMFEDSTFLTLFFFFGCCIWVYFVLSLSHSNMMNPLNQIKMGNKLKNHNEQKPKGRLVKIWIEVHYYYTITNFTSCVSWKEIRHVHLTSVICFWKIVRLVHSAATVIETSVRLLVYADILSASHVAPTHKTHDIKSCRYQ